MSLQHIAAPVLLEMIGKGNFSTVYRGFDPIHKEVAIKVLCQRDDESDEEWNARKGSLLNEGQRLKDAEHDHIVKVFSLYAPPTEDVLWLIMEHCSGGSAHDLYLKGPISLSRTRQIILDVAFGLDAIHLRQMIHRDIKPKNILFDQNNRAKLADFGLVTDKLLYGYAAGVGYYDHLAKEVFEEDRTSFRTDIYAFGMTMYRLLHGHTFYSLSPRPAALVRQGGIAQKLPWLPHIPEIWRRLIKRTLHDDPDRRPQTSSELMRQLERLPVPVNWQCIVDFDEVSWQRSEKGRQIRVVWHCTPSAQDSWEVYSSPIGGSKQRRLHFATGLTRVEAEHQLYQYLTKQRGGA